MHKNILILFVLLLPMAVFSQGMLYPVAVEERVGGSELIVEGKVLELQAELSGNGKIYTHHQVQVYRSFKGAATSTLEVITLGGKVGDQMMKVYPSLQLSPGDEGIFFLQESQEQSYKVYAGPQGFVQKSRDDHAVDVLKDHGSFEQEFVPQLVDHTGTQPVEVTPREQPASMPEAKTMAPNISSFGPDTVTAGTNSAIMINGSGFGSQSGQAAVQFRNADDPSGNSFISAAPSQVISWSANQIRVIVPSRAGTGTFRVVDQAGSTDLSSNALVVPYNLENLSFFNTIQPIRLADVNNNGGLTFEYNADFATNSNATQAFERALETWRCNTYANFSVASVTTDSACNSRNGLSVIAFDSQCQLGAGILGRAFSYYTFCSAEQLPQLVEADILFDDAPPSGWHYGASAPTGFVNDFESLALHELGHVHQLGHVLNPQAVMHPNLATGSARKNLNAVDLAGGNHVMDNSTTPTSCGLQAMDSLTASSCAIATANVDFTVSTNQACAPAEVTFMGSASFNPTSWQWDFDNDGTIDATTQNPTHTYTTAGNYTVKLIASDGSTQDSVVKTNIITVLASPVVDAGSDDTICSGEMVAIGGDPTSTGGSGDASYNWSPDSSLDTPNAPNPRATPEETTTFTVEVSFDNGCSSKDSVTIVVNQSPSIDINANQSVCEGDTAVVENNASNPPGTTYDWSYDGVIGDSTASSTYVVASTSGAIELTVTGTNGCEVTDAMELEVSEGPTVDAGEDHELCGGEEVRIGGSPTASGGAGGYTYLWQPFNGLNNSGLSNPQAMPASSETYTVLVMDAIGCEGVDSVNVEILPSPTADAGTAPDPVCAGETVDLGGEPTGSGGEGDLNYTWFPTQYVEDISDSNPKAHPEETTTFSVIVTDTNGCRGEDSVQVEVLPSPTANAGESATLCGSGTVTLGGNPAGSGGVAPLQYQWAPTLGFPGNEPNPEASLASSTAFTLTVTGANGCADEDSVVIEVLPELEVNTGSADTICYGECVTLGGNPVAQGGSGDYSYEWTANGTTIDSVANPEVCPASTTTYQVEVTDLAGCVETSEVTVQIKPFQEIEFTSLDTTYCENDDAVDLSATPVGGSFSGNGVTGDNFDPGEAGEGTHHIYYEYTTGNGCDIRDSFETSVLPNPSKPSILKSNDTLFTSQSFNSYQWLIDGSPIPNSDRHFYEPSTSGSYQVRVFNEEGCSNISDAEDVVVGIEEQLQEVDVAVHPNPSDGYFRMSIEADRTADLHMRITDLSGRMIRTDRIQVIPGKQQVVFNLSDRAAGVYLLQIGNDQGTFTEKLVIQD